MKNLKNALEKSDYQCIIKYRKNIENIVGQFLDEIISEQLSKRPLSIPKLGE
jgi:hypothetical protein